MKKLFCVIISVVVIVFFVGCSSGVSFVDGVDVRHFIPTLSSVGTTGCLIPKNLLEEFDYGENRFYWSSNDRLLPGDMDKTLLYVEYSDANYEEAKEYIMTEMNLNIAEAKEYNGYIFYLNNDFEPREIFPFQYTMAGYNDEKNRLIFLGMVCAEKSYPDVQYGETDFGLYLEIFFGEWYDFDA